MSDITPEYDDDTRSEQLDQDQFQPGQALEERGVDDDLDEGYSPPENYSVETRIGDRETLDERLAEEEPEPDPYAEPAEEDNLTVRDELENIDDGEVGDGAFRTTGRPERRYRPGRRQGPDRRGRRHRRRRRDGRGSRHAHRPRRLLLR